MGVKTASEIVEIAWGDHLETLRRCGGYYCCPKDEQGKRLGPLVGYAGKYVANDGSEEQWVGDVYANFAMAEVYPHVLFHFAQQMATGRTLLMDSIDVFCGAPLGGYSFADKLGFAFNRRVIKAEKKVTALATANAREQSTVIFGRHGVKPGDCVAIVEDVCNNFSTTDKLISLIEKSGGHVVAIICLLNRSLAVDEHYTPVGASAAIPVASLVRLPILEYRQDDPAVSDDVARGNVIWKPKDNWAPLMAAMEERRVS